MPRINTRTMFTAEAFAKRKQKPSYTVDNATQQHNTYKIEVHVETEPKHQSWL